MDEEAGASSAMASPDEETGIDQPDLSKLPSVLTERSRSSVRDALDGVRRAIWLEPEFDGRPEFQREQHIFRKGTLASQVDMWCRNSAASATIFLLILVIDVVALTWGVTDARTDGLRSGALLASYTAKALGRLVSVNLALTLLTSCKYLLTLIRSSAGNVIFPSDAIPDAHRILGSTLALAALGHCVAHAIIILSPITESAKASTRFIVSGALLFASLAVTTASAARNALSDARAFRLLSRAHVPAAFVMLATIWFHTTPEVIYLNAPALIFYAIDFTLRRFWVGKQHVIVLSCQALEGNDGLVRLELCRPHGFHFKAGQYIELSFPNISKYEYHPFTIASAPEDQSIVLFIKAQGRWTNELLQHARGAWYSERRSWTGKIQGPFGSPSQGFDDFRNVLLIASGIGITPMTSVFEHLVNVENYRNLAPTVALPAAAASSSTSARSSKSFRSRRITNPTYDLLDSDGATLESDGINLGYGSSNLEMSRISSIATSLRLAGARALAQRSFHSRVPVARWLRGLPVNVVLSWVSLASVGIWTCVALTTTSMGDNQAALIAGILLAAQLPLYAVIILGSSLEFGKAYWATLFFLWDMIPGLIIAAGIVISFFFRLMDSDSMALAASVHGVFIFANLLSFFRMFFLIHSAALPTDSVMEKQPRVLARRANRRRRKPKAENVDMVWVTPKLDEINWMLTERELRSAHYNNDWSTSVYLSRESEGDVETYAMSRQLEKGQVELFSGRPAWKQILTDALERCHAEQSGRPLGVFFCGKTSVSSEIKQIAVEVEMSHTLAPLDRVVSRSCHCRIVFREERFSR